VINAKITNFWFDYYYESTKVSGNYFDLNGNQIMSIPIPVATTSQQAKIIALVDQILSTKKLNPQADTTDLEDEIDDVVYALYDLSPEEIAIVEGRE
jgi:hypothetical protein